MKVSTASPSLSWTKALSVSFSYFSTAQRGLRPAAGAAPQRSPPRVTQLRYISVLSLANDIILYIYIHIDIIYYVQYVYIYNHYYESQLAG